MRHLKHNQQLKTQFLIELQDDIKRMFNDGIADTRTAREYLINFIESSVKDFWAANNIHMNTIHNLYQYEPVKQNRMERNNYHISYNDPVKSCAVYKLLGCSHVDGMLCEMETCTILKDFLKEEGIS